MTSPERQQSVDTALLCYYANDPARRPRCTLTATIQLCDLVLCASCNAARSTLGKGATPVPLPPSPAVEVLSWVATAHQQANNAEATLAAAVTRARQAGQSWKLIGAQLGLSRQGAQQRFTRPTRRTTPRQRPKVGPTFVKTVGPNDLTTLRSTATPPARSVIPRG